MNRRHAGVVLAAGASSRMGEPKALLKTPTGEPLADYQANLLTRAGCSSVVVVLGHDGAAVAKDLVGSPVVQNPSWAEGRFTSVRAGLEALLGFDGYFVLPVDSVGIRAATLQRLLEEAEGQQPLVLRPRWSGQPGRVVWLSAPMMEILRLEKRSDVRLDERLKEQTTFLEVDDPAVCNNINTPEDWEKMVAQNEPWA